MKLSNIYLTLSIIGFIGAIVIFIQQGIDNHRITNLLIVGWGAMILHEVTDMKESKEQKENE